MATQSRAVRYVIFVLYYIYIIVLPCAVNDCHEITGIKIRSIIDLASSEALFHYTWASAGNLSVGYSLLERAATFRLKNKLNKMKPGIW